jgi:hypothetical protein
VVASAEAGSPREAGQRVSADDLHVHPVNDLIDHELTGECPCGPQARPVERSDGSMGWLMVHNSLDAREKDEPEDECDGADHELR